MVQILKTIYQGIGIMIPFLRKSPKELKEFSELVTGQYEFLAAHLEKVLKDYLELSARVQKMQDELLELKKQLAKATVERCTRMECAQREQA